MQTGFMAAWVTTSWTPMTGTNWIRLTAELTPPFPKAAAILVGARSTTNITTASMEETGRRLTRLPTRTKKFHGMEITQANLLADRGSSRAPAFFVAVPPTQKEVATAVLFFLTF